MFHEALAVLPDKVSFIWKHIYQNGITVNTEDNYTTLPYMPLIYLCCL